jgi:hypothetical protein
MDRFLYRTRYFTDSGIIGSREFVSGTYWQFRHLFKSRHEKKPRVIKGLDGMFSCNTPGYFDTINLEYDIIASLNFTYFQ